MKSCAVGTSPVNLYEVASYYLTSSVVKHLSVRGQINLFFMEFYMNALLWDCCLSMHKSLLYQQPAAPVKQSKTLFFLFSVFITTVRELI